MRYRPGWERSLFAFVWALALVVSWPATSAVDEGGQVVAEEMLLNAALSGELKAQTNPPVLPPKGGQSEAVSPDAIPPEAVKVDDVPPVGVPKTGAAAGTNVPPAAATEAPARTATAAEAVPPPKVEGTVEALAAEALTGVPAAQAKKDEPPAAEVVPPPAAEVAPPPVAAEVPVEPIKVVEQVPTEVVPVESVEEIAAEAVRPPPKADVPPVPPTKDVPVKDVAVEDVDRAVEAALREAVREGIPPPPPPSVGARPAGAPPPPRETAVEEPAFAAAAEAEILRRHAYEAHAREALQSADTELADGRYEKAITLYKESITSSRLPQNEEMRKRAQRGLAEAYYRSALHHDKKEELDKAIAAAKYAMDEGHPRGEKLVLALIHRRDHPPVPPPPPRVARWQEPSYRDKHKQIADLMRSGKELYMAGEFNEARLRFESILTLDPYNTEALRYLQKVGVNSYDRATAEVEATREDMATQVRQAWNPRDYLPPDKPKAGKLTTEGETKTAIETMRDRILRKMRTIEIPAIDFRQAVIQDVVGFLQEQSVEFDKTEVDAGKKGVNIILNLQAGGGAGAAPPTTPADPFAAGGTPPAAGGAAGEVPVITFSARYISLLEALKIVTSVANLKYRIEGSVVMIVPLDAPEGEIMVRMYDVLPTVEQRIPAMGSELRRGAGPGTLEPGGTGAEPQDWKAFFEEMGVQWPTGSSIKYVPTIGKIVVANTEANLTRFEEILSVLNVVPNQIEIEARFVEISRRDARSLGFEWLLTDNWEVAQKKGAAALPLLDRERIVMTQNSGEGGFTKGMRFLSKGGVNALPDDIMTVASVLTNPELTLILHLLEQKGYADLLSAPKITTQAGQEATIKVVTEYIYPTDFEVTPITGVDPTGSTVIRGGVVEPSSFETRDVGVILSVLPDVSAEGRMINLTMTPQVVSEPDWKNYGSVYTDEQGRQQQLAMEQPFFHTRSVSTSISIYNGATVVMGGMINEVRKTVDDKIPLLGDIPLVGRFFQSRHEVSDKRNLLIFVTARLVDPAGRPIERSGEDIASRIATKPGTGSSTFGATGTTIGGAVPAPAVTP